MPRIHRENENVQKNDLKQENDVKQKLEHDIVETILKLILQYSPLNSNIGLLENRQ